MWVRLDLSLVRCQMPSVEFWPIGLVRAAAAAGRNTFSRDIDKTRHRRPALQVRTFARKEKV
jgi:hypothetical protein